MVIGPITVCVVVVAENWVVADTDFADLETGEGTGINALGIFQSLSDIIFQAVEFGVTRRRDAIDLEGERCADTAG